MCTCTDRCWEPTPFCEREIFEAGCVYGLLHGMKADELVRFASACSAIAISRFPLPLNPPTLEEVKEFIEKGFKNG